MTAKLLEMTGWLGENGVTHVATESTGVLWKPICSLLEYRCTVVVVKARHIEAVPGRKAGVNDAEWIVDHLQNGLLRPSFYLSDLSVNCES